MAKIFHVQIKREKNEKYFSLSRLLVVLWNFSFSWIFCWHFSVSVFSLSFAKQYVTLFPSILIFCALFQIFLWIRRKVCIFFLSFVLFDASGGSFTPKCEMITKMNLFWKISLIYCVVYFFFLYLRRGIDKVSSFYANKEQSI